MKIGQTGCLPVRQLSFKWQLDLKSQEFCHVMIIKNYNNI